MIISIINQHANNFGDESACVGVLLRLLEYDFVEEINLIYIGKGTVRYENSKVNHNRDINVKNIGIKQSVLRIIAKKLGIDYRGNSKLNQYLEIIEKSNVIFVSPAGADLGRYKGWAALLNMYLVDSCDKRLIFHLNTIVTSNNKLFDYLANRILKKSNIYVREKASQDYLASKNINCCFGVDSAFLLPNDDTKCSEKRITFIPTQLEGWNADYKGTNIEAKIYENVIKPVFDFACEHMYELVLLPHLGTSDELYYYESIIEHYGEHKNIHIAKEIRNVWDYQRQICNSSVVVSMRYHGVVISAKNAIPFVSIEYENKMREVSSYVGMEKQNIKVMDVTYSDLIQLLTNTSNHLELIKEKLEKNVKDLYKTAERPIKENVK